MEKKQNVPALRFQGFSGEWESHYLGMLGVTFSGLSGKTKADFGHGQARFVPYLNVFNHPIADLQETEAIEIDDKQNEVKYGDIFFTTSSETPEKVGMSSVWLGNEKNVYLNSFCFGYRPTSTLYPFFMAFLLRSSSVRKEFVFLAQGISRYNISKNKAMGIGISFPLFREQCKIGDFFQNLDKFIDGKSHKIQKLQQFRQAMLTKLFPREGAAEPELRFRGFSGKWERRNLLENFRRIIDFRGRTPKKLGMDWSTEGYLALSALNVKDGYIDFKQECHYGSQELYDKWMTGNELHKGQVVFTTEAPMGNVAQIPDDKKYILSQRTIAFEVKPDLINEDFLATLLRTPQMFQKLSALSSGGTAKGISQRSMEMVEAFFPTDILEQKKIGAFFKNLDSIISLQQKKLERMQRLKAALLEKLFV